MSNDYEIKIREIKDYIIELVNNNEFEEAKELIKEYSLKVPKDAEIYSIMSIIYINENNLNEAEKTLREGLKVDNNNFDLMYNLAYLYESTDLKCLPLALNYYKRCLNHTENKEFKSTIISNINKINDELFISKDNSKPLVSIVLLAYNQLSYTKSCVESIYKYTSHINFELITVNNGSSDDTQLYFESLPNVKKVNIINNVRPVDGFNAGIEFAEGEFTACVCNDFIFTQNWLDNLLKCIQSDESIGFVSPGASKVSNYQKINSDYKSIDEMQQFAKNYNISDPKKWEEKIKLLPCVLLCRSKLLKDIGGYDPRFYFGDFADDDISFRIRRLGKKLIYAKDTFVHHAGSITTEKDHVENNSLSVSKKIFINKYNIDTLIEANYSPEIVESINYRYCESANILGINTFCGGTPLQIKNELKKACIKEAKITSITENEKYIEDLKTVSDEVYCLSGDNILKCIKEKKYDFIVYENGLDNVNDIDNTIDLLKHSLNKGGQLVFTINNEAYYENLFYIHKYQQNLYGSQYKTSYLNLQKIIDMLSIKKFSDVKINRLIMQYNHELVDILISAASNENREEFKRNIVTYKFIISCSIK